MLGTVSAIRCGWSCFVSCFLTSEWALQQIFTRADEVCYDLKSLLEKTSWLSITTDLSFASEKQKCAFPIQDTSSSMMSCDRLFFHLSRCLIPTKATIFKRRLPMCCRSMKSTGKLLPQNFCGYYGRPQLTQILTQPISCSFLAWKFIPILLWGQDIKVT